MRMSARLGLGFAFSVLVPVAALAGGHAPSAPGPRVIQLAARPVYAPPAHALYGPPQGIRHGWRHRGRDAGFAGFPTVYAPAAEAAVAAPTTPSGEYLRPRAAVVYNYAGPPPLWQGDAGYVAQPVIYNVQTVLRRYPLTGMAPLVGK
ncbi:MAG TPA: hypothetical protein PKA55_01805 [Rhodoblastus sp.]|nr:hypothetical protein [Rhodoblastus sp.]